MYRAELITTLSKPKIVSELKVERLINKYSHDLVIVFGTYETSRYNQFHS